MREMIDREGIIPELKEQLREIQRELLARPIEAFGTVVAETTGEAETRARLRFPESFRSVELLTLSRLTPETAYELGRHEGEAGDP